LAVWQRNDGKIIEELMNFEWAVGDREDFGQVVGGNVWKCFEMTLILFAFGMNFGNSLTPTVLRRILVEVETVA
jgi:hypothetical protein